MHRDPPAVFGPVLRFFLRVGREHFRIVLAAHFQLFHFAHVDRGFEVPRQAGNVAHRHFARVEELMRRPIGHMNDRAWAEIVAFVVENHEAFAALDIDRLFAVQMFAGMPAHRDLRPHHAAAAGRETQLRRDHQGRFEILRRAHPLEIFRTRESWRLGDRFFIGFGLFQPIRIKIAHLIPPKFAFLFIRKNYRTQWELSNRRTAAPIGFAVLTRTCYQSR